MALEEKFEIQLDEEGKWTEQQGSSAAVPRPSQVQGVRERARTDAALPLLCSRRCREDQHSPGSR